MLKQTVTYTDYNDEQSTETLYFNLNKTELMDMQQLVPRLNAWQNMTAGEDRDLTGAEALEVLSIVKDLIKASYGVRSSDGKRFQKTRELYSEFEQSAVYDNFIFGLFETPEKAVNFMTGILPKDLLASIKDVELPDEGQEDTTPAYVRQNRNPTQGELLAMSKEELQEAFRHRK